MSLRNFVTPSNISWMTIAKCPPTKHWRRLSSVQHDDGQQLWKLKVALEPYHDHGRKLQTEKKKQHAVNFKIKVLLEAGILGSGIRRLTKNPKSSTLNPESTAWSPEPKTVLYFLKWGEARVREDILSIYFAGGLAFWVSRYTVFWCRNAGIEYLVFLNVWY